MTWSSESKLKNYETVEGLFILQKRQHYVHNAYLDIICLWLDLIILEFTLIKLKASYVKWPYVYLDERFSFLEAQKGAHSHSLHTILFTELVERMAYPSFYIHTLPYVLEYFFEDFENDEWRMLICANDPFVDLLATLNFLSGSQWWVGFDCLILARTFG